MITTSTARCQYYRDAASDISYYAERTGPLSLSIHRQENPRDALRHIAVVGFSDIYNPDGPWYVQPVGDVRWNRVHRMRFQRPAPAATLIAKEDALITHAQRRNQDRLPEMRTEGQADLDRFFEQNSPEPGPTQLPPPH